MKKGSMILVLITLIIISNTVCFAADKDVPRIYSEPSTHFDIVENLEK